MKPFQTAKVKHFNKIENKYYKLKTQQQNKDKKWHLWKIKTVFEGNNCSYILPSEQSDETHTFDLSQFWLCQEENSSFWAVIELG